MGISLLFSGTFRLRTFAYFALTINLFLAIYSHISAGDGLANAAPAGITFLFAAVVFYMDYNTASK